MYPQRLRCLVLADTYAGWKGSLPEPVCRERWRVASVTRWRHPAPSVLRCCPASSAIALLKTFRTSRRPSCLSSIRLAFA